MPAVRIWSGEKEEEEDEESIPLVLKWSRDLGTVFE